MAWMYHKVSSVVFSSELRKGFSQNDSHFDKETRECSSSSSNSSETTNSCLDSSKPSDNGTLIVSTLWPPSVWLGEVNSPVSIRGRSELEAWLWNSSDNSIGSDRTEWSSRNRVAINLVVDTNSCRNGDNVCSSIVSGLLSLNSSNRTGEEVDDLVRQRQARVCTSCAIKNVFELSQCRSINLGRVDCNRSRRLKISNRYRGSTDRPTERQCLRRVVDRRVRLL